MREKIAKIIYDQQRLLGQEATIKAMKQADKILDLLPQWVHIDDRLPEKPKPGDDKYKKEFWVTDGKNTGIMHWASLVKKRDGVTHWMPLPQPPQPPKDLCEHDKGINDYCEPCGRINSN